MANTQQTPSLALKVGELSPAKRALLERRLKQNSLQANGGTIPQRGSTDPAPLSFTQELLWLQDQITPGPAYNVPRGIRLSGELDVEAMKATLRDIVQRQEVLRTRFAAVSGDPIQIVDENVIPDLEIIDLQKLPDEEREAEAVRFVKERSNQCFDLSSDLLLRCSLLRMGPLENILLLITHHIASDGWSRDVLFRELDELYDAHRTGRAPRLPDLPIRYGDYAAWQRAEMEGASYKLQLKYWKQRLDGIPSLLNLPIDFPRPAVQGFSGARYRKQLLTKDEFAKLKALGLEEKATQFMTTLACAKVFLYRQTRQRDIVVGTPIAGRSHTETENLQGYFTNTLALRTQLAPEMSFREALGLVRETSLGAFEHQDLPYARLVAEINPERTLSYNPVFQVLFGSGQLPAASNTLSNLTITPFKTDRDISKFDFTISLGEKDDGLAGMFEYKTDLFEHGTIAQMMDRFETLMKGILANPDAPIASLPLLTDAEREQLVVEWNNTGVEYPSATSVHELFESQVQKTPEATAVEFAGKKWSYDNLNEQANRIAHCLKACGVGPDVPVGILIERSADLVAGLLGILKAGGAYVPLDENYPAERIQHILRVAEAPIVITQSGLVNNLDGYAGHVICLDREQSALDQKSSENPASCTTPENLAYVMFTSGSTGQPKGIAVPHSALLHFARAAMQTYGLTAADRVLQFASICFDTSIEEIFPCLTIGATLVVRTREMLDSLAQFWKRTGEWGITFLSLPTALWHELAATVSEHAPLIPAHLRLIVIGGEKARADRLDIWRQFVGERVQMLNTYGPTESTVVATACDITAPIHGEIPIGRPIPNVRAYLLDEMLQPVPRGVTGEIYLGGPGIARGYINDPVRTGASFVPDQFVSGGRLYRTGDLGKYRLDGNIEFMGRADNQVKIRGFRIELEEIEAVLAQHPDVNEAVVMANDDGSGGLRLTAYLRIDAGLPKVDQSLRKFIAARLPHYMVPSSFFRMEAFPTTPGGKVDRHKLRNLSIESLAIEDVSAPVDETLDEVETHVKRLWEEVLHGRSIRADDDFFELGGHSLLAIRLLSDVKREFTYGISLAEMLKAPTVRLMAALLREKEQGNEAWSPIVSLQTQGDKLPLFCAPVGGGSAFYYRTLASHIGQDQPLYTFEPIGMNGADEPHKSVEEMAAYYIRHMRKIQPKGPYSICGLSFGGIVAYEMARQITASGEKVACLVLFDCRAPGDSLVLKREVDSLHRAMYRISYGTRFHLENLSVYSSSGERWRYLRARTSLLRKRIRDQVRGKSWRLSRENPILMELPEIYLKVRAADALARANYLPENYPGHLLLLKAHLQKPEYAMQTTLGWDSIAPNTQVIETPGSHFSLLEEPCVRVTVGHVKQALESTRNPA